MQGGCGGTHAVPFGSGGTAGTLGSGGTASTGEAGGTGDARSALRDRQGGGEGEGPPNREPRAAARRGTNNSP